MNWDWLGPEVGTWGFYGALLAAIMAFTFVVGLVGCCLADMCGAFD